MAKLTGDALLEFVRSKDGTDRDVVIKEAGYCVMRGGRESLQRTLFFQALCAAQGTSLGNILPKPGKGRAPTYVEGWQERSGPCHRCLHITDRTSSLATSSRSLLMMVPWCWNPKDPVTPEPATAGVASVA